MKKGYVIAGSLLLVCLIVLAVIFSDGHKNTENPQEPIEEESDSGLEVLDPEQMEEEEEENVFIAPDKNKTDTNSTENNNSTNRNNMDNKNEVNDQDEQPQGGDNSDKNENKDNTENNENSKPSKGDLDENEEDDGKTHMGEFF